jgi:hypothetical protein
MRCSSWAFSAFNALQYRVPSMFLMALQQGVNKAVKLVGRHSAVRIIISGGMLPGRDFSSAFDRCRTMLEESVSIRGDPRRSCLSVQNPTCHLVVISGRVFWDEERSRSVALGKSLKESCDEQLMMEYSVQKLTFRSQRQLSKCLFSVLF